jgi:hypothetical protein
MNFPTIFDWLARAGFLRGFPAAYLVLATAFLVVALWEWRLAILALAVQYLMAGLLFADLLDPRLIVVKILVGIVVCLILLVTAAQVGWGRLPADMTEEERAQLGLTTRSLGPFQVPRQAPLRLLLAAGLSLIILVIARQPAYQLPVVAEPQNLAIFALVGLGLLGLASTTEPLPAGMGLFMVLTGFDLFYSAVDQSLAMLGALAAANLLIALAIAYLVQVRYTLASTLG